MCVGQVAVCQKKFNGPRVQRMRCSHLHAELRIIFCSRSVVKPVPLGPRNSQGCVGNTSRKGSTWTSPLRLRQCQSVSRQQTTREKSAFFTIQNAISTSTSSSTQAFPLGRRNNRPNPQIHAFVGVWILTLVQLSGVS